MPPNSDAADENELTECVSGLQMKITDQFKGVYFFNVESEGDALIPVVVKISYGQITFYIGRVEERKIDINNSRKQGDAGAGIVLKNVVPVFVGSQTPIGINKQKREEGHGHFEVC